MRAASARLDRQLAQDQYVRDLAHVRGALEPIVARALDTGPISALAGALEVTGGFAPEANREVHVRPRIEAVLDHAIMLQRDRAALYVLLPADAPLAGSLSGVSDSLVDAAHKAEAWLAGAGAADTDAMRTEAARSHAQAVSVFLNEAYKTTGWHHEAATAA